MKFARYSIAVLLMLGAAFAQQGPPMRRKAMMAAAQAGQNPQTFQALADYLKLSAEQQTQLKAVQTSMRDAIQPLAPQLRSESMELRDALKQDPVDSAKVTQLRADIQKLRDDIKSQRDSFAAKSRQILSVEQQKSLDALEQALSLQAAARQAAHLGLIAPPEGDGARGAFGGGRGMMGRGFGPRR